MEYLWRTDGQAMEEPRGFGYVGTRINVSSTDLRSLMSLANNYRESSTNYFFLSRFFRIFELFFAEAHQAEASHVAERSVIFVELTLKQKTSS